MKKKGNYMVDADKKIVYTDTKLMDKKEMDEVITLVLPIAFQQFMLALVSASDALMLGKLTQSALSAVSLASQVTFVENLFLAAMAIGLSIFAAQYWGKGDIGIVEEYFAYVFRITVYISAVFMAGAFFIPKQLMNIFTTDGALIEYTIPVLGNQMVWGIGFTMYSVIMGHLGTDAVAANSIVNIVKNLILCFCFGLGMGGSIMVGNEMGAGRLDVAKAYGGKLCRMAVIFGVVSGVILLLLSPVILSVTSLSQQAAYYLKFMFFICAVNMVGQSINSTTIGGIFCAGGDSGFGFLCDAVTMWVVIVPLAMVSAFVFKLPVIWVFLIISLDEIIKLPVVYWRFKQYKWVKDLTKTHNNSKN